MPDPSWSDNTRNDIHQDYGFALGLGQSAYVAELLCHPQNGKYLVVTTDETAQSKLTNWLLTAGEVLLDTDANGWCYGKLTDESPGAGQATLAIYRGPNRDNSADDELVATGSAADGATLTLTAQTGYTLTGTVKLGTIAANLNFAFMLIEPPIRRLDYLFDGSSIDDAQIRERGKATLDRMRAAYASAKTAAEDFARFVVTTKIRRQLVGVSDAKLLIDPGLKQTSGVVREEPRGLHEDLRSAQAANTGGSAEIKAGAASLSGSVTFPVWSGRATSVTYGQRGIAAGLEFYCTKTLTSTPPEFQVTRKPTDTRRALGDGTESEVHKFKLQVGKNWAAPEWGISAVTINYAPTITNSTGTSLSATSTDWSVTGLTSTNSNGGIVYTYYTGSILKFYRTSAGRDAQDADELVAQVSLATTDDATTFTTDESDSGITISGKTGAGTGSLLVSGDTGTVNFNVPQATSPASLALLTITEATEGSEWVKAIRDRMGWYPNTGGSPNLQDGWIRAGHLGINASVLGDRD